MRFEHHLHAGGCGHRGFARFGMARGGWGEGREGRSGWSGRGGFRGDGGGRRRLFDGNELRLILLKLIADEPRHGYDLIRAMGEASGEAYAPSPGVIYPTLTLLTDMGQISELESGGARRVFAVTDEGRAALAKQEALVTTLFERLAALGEDARRNDPASIRRAMHNLGMALRERIGRGDAEAATLDRIAEMLDDVTRRIERL